MPNEDPKAGLPEVIGAFGPGGVYIPAAPARLPAAGTPASGAGPGNPGYYGAVGALVPRPSPVPNPAGDIETWQSALEAENQAMTAMLTAKALGRDVSDVPLPRGQESTAPGLFSILMDYASRPSSAWFGMTKSLLAGEGLEAAGQAAGAGWAGRQKTGFSDILQQVGVPEMGRFNIISPFSAEEKQAMLRVGVDPAEAELAITGRGVLGLAGDILLDPFQYWSFGMGKGVQLSAKILPKTLSPGRWVYPAVTLSDAGKAMLSREIQRFGFHGVTPAEARELAELSVQQHVAQGMGELIKVPSLRFMGASVPGSEWAFGQAGKAIKAGKEFVSSYASAETKEFGTRLMGIMNRDFSVRNYLSFMQDKITYLNKDAGLRHETIQEIGAFMKAGNLTKADRERITWAMERETQGAVANLTLNDPRLGNIAVELRKRFNDMRVIEAQLGLGYNVRLDYVNHIYKNPPVSPRSSPISQQISTAMKQSKKRTYDVFEEAIEEGLVPLTQDILELYAIRRMAHNRAVLAHELLTKTARKYGFGIEEKALHQRALGKISRGVALTADESDIILRAKEVGVGTQIIWDDLKPVSSIKGLEGHATFAPRAIVEDLQRAVGMQQINPLEATAVIRAYDQASNLFKGYVTSFFPAFQTRNMISNVALSALDIGIQALNPIRHWQSRSVLAGKKNFDIVTELGETFSSKQILAAAKDRGMLGTFKHKGEFMTSLRQEMGLGNKLDNIIGTNSPQLKVGRAVGDFVEDEARMLLFIANVRRGYSFDQAAQRVNKFLFDYANLSPVERGLFRRIMPFYTFTRKNIPLQIETAIKKPGVPMLYSKVFGQEGRVDPEEVKYLPEWAASGLAVRMGTINGNPVYFSGLGLPMEDLNRLVAPGGPEGKRQKATVSNWLFTMTPFVREAIGFFAAYDFQRNQPLDPHSPMYRSFGQLVENHGSQGVKDWLEFRVDHDARGVPTYQMSSNQMHLLRSFILSRLYTTGGRLLDVAQTPGQSMMAILTGLRLEPVDIEHKRIQMESRRSHERREQAQRHETQAERNVIYTPRRLKQ